MIPGVSGVILAGGRSTRYGRNKALVKIDGVPLIEKVTGLLKELFGHVIIITNTPGDYAYLGLPMHEDLLKGLGPLGGIYTALSVIPNGYGFVFACDMPLLNRDLLLHMAKLRKDYDIVAPKVGWKIEALHAIYGKTCLPAIRRLIASRDYQVIRIFSDVSVRYVEETEIRPHDPEMRSFLNINSPLEMMEYLKIR